MCPLTVVLPLVVGLLQVSLAQLVASTGSGQVGLSLSPNTAFLALPGEVQLETQLRAWGVQVNLHVDVDFLGLKLLDTRRSRDKDARGLRLGSNAKLDTGVLKLNAEVQVGLWGQAESQARGERGDSAVRRVALRTPRLRLKKERRW